jgi:hypothetical protein
MDPKIKYKPFGLGPRKLPDDKHMLCYIVMEHIKEKLGDDVFNVPSLKTEPFKPVDDNIFKK